MDDDVLASRDLNLPSRNDVLGFAERTRRNLDFIRAAHEQGEDVHVVTQAVLSLLGIVVFPYEEYFKKHHLRHTLAHLEAHGWPHWNQAGRAVRTLGDLLHKIRNATAHRSIEFSSDSGQPGDVVLVFQDRKQWRGEISTDDLLDFCSRFLRYVEDYVR